MEIEVITIDFWNTLFDSGNGIGRNNYRLQAFRKEIDLIGLEIEEVNFNKALQASWEFFNNAWINEMRTPSTLETVNYLWKFLNLPTNPESVERLSTAFGECILIYPPNLIEGVKEILPLLSQSFKLGIVSDTGFSPGKMLQNLLENENIEKYFSAFSFSDETGVSKPHPKAFLKIFDEINITPEKGIHIGDIEETDIKGARQLGMHSIRFNGDSKIYPNNEKRQSTKADFESGSWKEIYEYILKL